MLEYYLGIDTSALDDKQWAKKIAALQQIRVDEAKANLGNELKNLRF
jgi:hypothetical protein